MSNTDWFPIVSQLVPEQDGEGATALHTATVTADNGDGTVDVQWSGGVLTAPVLASTFVAVGDVVHLLLSPQRALVLGATSKSVAGAGLVRQRFYTSDNTWVKADYPGIRAVRVKVQAGGGGGQGSSTNNSGGPGGGGGGYAESFFLASALPATVNVFVGAGGNGNVGPGSGGGPSAFSTLVSASGGRGGGETSGVYEGGVGGTGTAGQIQLAGTDGMSSGNPSNYSPDDFGPIAAGSGGNSILGGGGRGAPTRAANGNGQAGGRWGGGGGGGFRRNQNVSGGNGAGGCVIVEIYN